MLARTISRWKNRLPFLTISAIPVPDLTLQIKYIASFHCSYRGCRCVIIQGSVCLLSFPHHLSHFSVVCQAAEVRVTLCHLCIDYN